MGPIPVRRLTAEEARQSLIQTIPLGGTAATGSTNLLPDGPQRHREQGNHQAVPIGAAFVVSKEGIEEMSTYSITASGPSNPLAHLRALWVKRATSEARRNGRPYPRPSTGRLAAETGLDLLTTDAGYDTASAIVSGTVSLAWRCTATFIRGIGKGVVEAARAMAKAVGIVAPEAAARVRSRIDQATKSVSSSWAGTDAALRTVGSVFEAALQEPTVRFATTSAAQGMSLLLFVHVVTSGGVAARLVQLAPWTLDAVLVATNPATALGAVLGITGIALLFALARMIAEVEAEGKPDGGPSVEGVVPNTGGVDARVFAWENGRAHNHLDGIDDVGMQPMVAEITEDLEAIARTVRVEVQADGSVVVHGIPDTVPQDLGLVVAEIVREAVEQQLRRVLQLRPVPTRNDRRVLTKAAREAILAEAQRRQREGQHAVA